MVNTKFWNNPAMSASIRMEGTVDGLSRHQGVLISALEWLADATTVGCGATRHAGGQFLSKVLCNSLSGTLGSDTREVWSGERIWRVPKD